MKKNVINPEKLRQQGYGEAAIESLAWGLAISYWDENSEQAQIIRGKYRDYETFFIKEYPDGTRYLFGAPERKKTYADLLEELPEVER